MIEKLALAIKLMNFNSSSTTTREDNETQKWLAEIESFRSPPPPRKLLGSNLVTVFNGSSQKKTPEIKSSPKHLGNLTVDFDNLKISKNKSQKNVESSSSSYNSKSLNFPRLKNGILSEENAKISPDSNLRQPKMTKNPILVGEKALKMQQDKFEKFEREIERQLSNNNKIVYDFCFECKQPVDNPDDATQALNRLYHSQCFVCFQCGRLLTNKKFYEAGGKIYCEEDYLFSGYQQSTERCAACNHFIMDMILQAAEKSYHPSCFRCQKCRCSLDGQPFTMDGEEKVYCVDDYHKLFAPRCAKCCKAILPVSGRDETVRVVAMEKDYHVDCYICEFCGLQLTDENGKRCFPMQEHLLCQNCHFKFSNNDDVRITRSPVTDV